MRERDISVYIRKHIYEYNHGTEFYINLENHKKKYWFCINQLTYYKNCYFQRKRKLIRIYDNEIDNNNNLGLMRYILRENNYKRHLNNKRSLYN